MRRARRLLDLHAPTRRAGRFCIEGRLRARSGGDAPAHRRRGEGVPRVPEAYDHRRRPAFPGGEIEPARRRQSEAARAGAHQEKGRRDIPRARCFLGRPEEVLFLPWADEKRARRIDPESGKAPSRQRALAPGLVEGLEKDERSAMSALQTGGESKGEARGGGAGAPVVGPHLMEEPRRRRGPRPEPGGGRGVAHEA